MIDIILITITITVLIIAAIIDIKTHEIPDYLTYSLIFTGLIIKLIYSILINNFNYILYGLIGLLAMYLIGSLLYYTKQWGGGDTKLLMGLGVTLTMPAFIQAKFPFLLILFLNIIIIGAIYGIIIGFILAIKNFKKFVQEFKKISKLKLTKTLELILFIISLPILSLIFLSNINKLIILFLFIIINLYIPLLIIIKSIEKIVMYKLIPTKNLSPGDWLIKPIKKNKKILVKSRTTGLTKKDIKLLIKNKIKSVLIKEGIPFVPSITIATILTLIYPKIFFFF